MPSRAILAISPSLIRHTFILGAITFEKEGEPSLSLSLNFSLYLVVNDGDPCDGDQPIGVFLRFDRFPRRLFILFIYCDCCGRIAASSFLL